MIKILLPIFLAPALLAGASLLVLSRAEPAAPIVETKKASVSLPSERVEESALPEVGITPQASAETVMHSASAYAPLPPSARTPATAPSPSFHDSPQAPAARSVSVISSRPDSRSFSPTGPVFLSGAAGSLPGTAAAVVAPQASNSSPEPLPAALVPESPEIPITTDQQVAQWEQIQDDFVAQTGGRYPKDSAARARWRDARREADERFRSTFGVQAFLVQQMEAYRRSGKFE